LARLPPPVQNLVEAEVRRLAEDPVHLSRPSIFPYIPCQSYRVTTTHDDVQYFMTVLFRYSQDETTIHIIGIATTRIG